MSAIGAFRGGTQLASARTRRPGETLLLLLLLIVPLAASPPFQVHIVDFPGAKLANLFAGAFALAFLTDPARLLRPSSRLERGALLAFAGYVLVFAVAFLRSVPNIGKFHGIDQDTFPASAKEYALSSLLIPLIFASTFAYTLKCIRSAKSISRLLQTVGISMFVLTCVVLAAIASRPEVYADPKRFAMAKLTSDVLGMHYNAVGTFYIVTGPILLYLALKRSSFWALNYFLALLAVILLESRAALFIFAAMSVGTLVVLGRARTLIAMAPPVILVAVVAAGPLLVQLLTMGFTARSGISITLFLSAREDYIWLPLIVEWWSDPQRFWFGAGEYGILSSFMLFSGVILAVAHSHNAYLDFFLDNGIVLESVLLGAIVAFLVWARRIGRRLNDPLYWVLFLSVTGFLVAAMVGRRFYPESENAFLFPILAMLINVARLGLPGHVSADPAPADSGSLMHRTVGTKN